MTITYNDVRARIGGAPAQRTQAVKLVLPAQSVMSLKGTKRGLTIRCHEGRVWLTQAWDAQDYLLLAGEAFTAKTRGAIVLQALEEAVVGLAEGAANAR
jgi:hypothetical protein